MNPFPLQRPSWTAAEKGLFRFFCCFFVFYIFPFPLDSLPFITELTRLNPKLTGWYTSVFEAYTNLGHTVIPRIGNKILHLKTPITIFTNGSGDTTYDYTLLFTECLLALVAAAVWTLADRHRKSYYAALYWLRVLLRYFLAYNLIYYGFGKVFHLQMPFPSLSQLVQRFGDKSPMGLAWSFVGYSKAYSAYTGWAEVLGGSLLLFRRTTTIGALVSCIVMLNVAMLNFCFDIPVKLFSSVLFLMSVFLVEQDASRLWHVLVLNKPTPAIYTGPYLTRRRIKMAGHLLKGIFILYLYYFTISSVKDGQKEYGDDRPKPPLYGIYNTQHFVLNKDTLPPLTTDTSRWKQLIIQFEKHAQVMLMNDSLQPYNFIVDTASGTVSLYTNTDTLHKSALFYHTDSTGLTLQGKIRSDSVYMRFKKYDINKFRLVNRGFNWINEYPYNR